MSNPEDKAKFQAGIYDNIYPETTNSIIAAAHRPNLAMHEIITSVNRLPIHYLEGIILIRIS